MRKANHNSDRRTLGVGETIQALRKAKTKKEKVEILHRGNTTALQSILRINFDPNITSALPEGSPPYRKNEDPEGLSPTDLKREAKRFYYFLNVRSSEHVKQSQKEKVFLGIIERVSPIEAEILIEAKDKKLKINCTKKIIEEVFPGLINWS